MPAESRYIYGSSVNRRSSGTPSAFTGAPPGHYRRRPGLNRGVAVALPGSDDGIVPVSAGGVTVYRGSAGTLPAFTGAQPGNYQRQPWLCRGFTGINCSCSTGLTGTLPGCGQASIRAATGTSFTALKIILVLAGRPLANRDGPGLYRQ
ncbi:hypothetical protein DPMN_190897 [Dreissena polymorpha]|uniref:Uncharacterized protein n=1 Tax=Dreissena polymorpha TaxID=45954 RepID=A0A9D3Y2B7_DREPO|nr:hypothetical protein DPMN_190897 [Dreissena polymorpha]